MNAKDIIKTLNLTVEHALYREDGLWYHHLKKFPAILFDKSGYVLFETEDAYKTNVLLQHAKALHVIGGINNIPGYILFTEEQRFKLAIQVQDDKEDHETIVRKKRLIDAILRNKKLVIKIKKLYNNKCQLCELQLIVGRGQFYSEVHHIVPLGNPHNGADIIENMICVCPNCHVQLDLGALKLDTTRFKSTLHKINKHYADYHNTAIYKN